MPQDFTDWLVYRILEFTPNTRLGEAVNFFVYDMVKIVRDQSCDGRFKRLFPCRTYPRVSDDEEALWV